jgi:ankyrin repeat protein
VAVRRTDSLPLIQTLLDAGVAVNARANIAEGSYPLHLAAELNKPDMCEAILKKKAKTEVRDEYGNTPLHQAVRFADIRVVGLLMAAGANPDAKDRDGTTPRDYAMYRPNKEELLTALNRRK